jgi:predicted Rossmann fold nucleotide-binding protein DprA/Smf involved in DNA uptake
MKSTEMISQIKTLLNIEVKLEETKLENGTIVSAESFEKGKEIFIVTDDEKVAMPVGEYLLEDGRLVVVEEEGIIADVREVSDEVPEKETEEGEEITSDLAEEQEEEVVETDLYATKEELGKVIDMIQEIKAMIDGKEDMSEEGSNTLKSRTVKEEFSEASVKPIKHNPEGETPQTTKFEFGKGKFNTTLDRVLNKLNK